MGIYSKGLRAECWADFGTPLAIAALFTVAKRWKQSQNRLTDEQTNKIWSVHTGIVFSLKRKGVLTHSTVGMNLEDNMLHGAVQSQDDKICMIPLIMGVRGVRFTETKWNGGFQGQGREEAMSQRGNADPFFPRGRSPGRGNGNPLQYPCLEKPMDRGAWQSTVHGVTMNRT